MSTSAPDVDTIRLTGLSARGRHGVLPSERREGQLFVVDVTLGLGRRGTAVAAVTDSLNDAIDYGKVAASVIAVIEGDPVNLLETLAERVSDAVGAIIFIFRKISIVSCMRAQSVSLMNSLPIGLGLNSGFGCGFTPLNL